MLALKKSDSSEWHRLLTVVYQKTQCSLIKLAGILEVPRLTARTWLRRPKSQPRDVDALQQKLEGFIEAPKISAPNKSSRHRMWQSMRCLQIFTVENIMATANTGLSTTQKYVRALANAGYTKIYDKKSHHVYWHLIKNTGPKAPEIGRNRDFVYDPNTNRLAWQKKIPADRTDDLTIRK
ncbi:MAG: hypothetical protein ACD_39C01666G0001 [uncultured bacterium]|nr:MAG: hypothetical protein ACD_39C01666G0001 [uncultured bacterium]